MEGIYNKKLSRVGDGKSRSTNVVDTGDNTRYISQGGFGRVYSKEFRVGDKTVTLAEKVHKKGTYSDEDLGIIMFKHKLLKDAGVNTYTTLRTDGKSLYSTMLNKDGFVALSINNDTPVGNDSKKYDGIYLGKIEIANLREMCEELFRQAKLAVENGILLSEDSIFYVIPEDVSHGPVNIDFIIGDFDKVIILDKHPHNKDSYLFNLALGFVKNTKGGEEFDKLESIKRHAVENMRDATLKFIGIYCNDEALLEYKAVANDVFGEIK